MSEIELHHPDHVGKLVAVFLQVVVGFLLSCFVSQERHRDVSLSPQTRLYIPVPHERRMFGDQFGVTTQIVAYDRKGSASFVRAVTAITDTILQTIGQ